MSRGRTARAAAGHGPQGWAAPQAAQRAPGGAQAAALALQGLAGNAAVHGLVGSGEPLEAGVRGEMEARFGADFGAVRVHTGPAAEASAQAMGARAYTVGGDLVFGPGRFAPATGEGRRLLAHELAHVVQQRAGGGGPAESAATEAEAGAAAQSVVAGGQAAVSQGASVGVARDKEEIPWWKQKLNPLYNKALETLPPSAAAQLEQVNELARTMVEEHGITDEQLNHVVAQATPVVETTDAALDVAQQAPAMIDSATDAVKAEASKKARAAIYTTKGVAVEASSIIDIGLWVDQTGHDLKKGAIKATLGTGAADWYDETFSDPLMKLAKQQGLVKVDEVTGTPSITPIVAEGYDLLADYVAPKDPAAAAEEYPLLFNDDELNELTGAVGSQIALAFVGGTEAQIALKAVGAVGAVKGLVESIQRDKNWASSTAFWTSLINVALSVLSLRNLKAAKKIPDMLIASGFLINNAAPIVWQLYLDYQLPESTPEEAEARRKKLVAGYGNLIKVLKDAVLMAIQHGGVKGKGGAPEPEPIAPAKAAGQTGAEPPPSTTPKIEQPVAGAAQAPRATAGDTAAAPPLAKQATPPPPPVKQLPPPQATVGTTSAPPTTGTPAAPAGPTSSTAPTPIGKGRQYPKSAQSQANAQKLRNATRGGKPVTTTKGEKLPPQPKAAEAPVPVAEELPIQQPQKIAVGQTHSPDAPVAMAGGGGKGGGGKPSLVVVPGGSKGGGGTGGGGKAPPAAPIKGAKGSSAKPAATKRPSRRKEASFGDVADALKAVPIGKGPPKSTGSQSDFEPQKPFPPNTKPLVKFKESAGASTKDPVFESAGAETNRSTKTAVLPDIGEVQAYKTALANGEIGLQRPLGANAPGADFITAGLVDGEMTIFVNDAKTSVRGRFPTPQKKLPRAWRQEAKEAVARMKLKNPKDEQAILEALDKGRIVIRQVNVDRSGRSDGVPKFMPFKKPRRR